MNDWVRRKLEELGMLRTIEDAGNAEDIEAGNAEAGNAEAGDAEDTDCYWQFSLPDASRAVRRRIMTGSCSSCRGIGKFYYKNDCDKNRSCCLTCTCSNALMSWLIIAKRLNLAKDIRQLVGTVILDSANDEELWVFWRGSCITCFNTAAENSLANSADGQEEQVEEEQEAEEEREKDFTEDLLRHALDLLETYRGQKNSPAYG